MPAVLDTVIDQGNQASGDNHVGHISSSIHDGRITDPHVTWRDPATGPFFLLDLVGAPHLRSNVGDSHAVAVSHEVVGDHAEVLVENALPRVLVAPPLKVVVVHLMVVVPGYVDARIVAKLELDRVGGDQAGR